MQTLWKKTRLKKGKDLILSSLKEQFFSVKVSSQEWMFQVIFSALASFPFFNSFWLFWWGQREGLCGPTAVLQVPNAQSEWSKSLILFQGPQWLVSQDFFWEFSDKCVWPWMQCERRGHSWECGVWKHFCHIEWGDLSGHKEKETEKYSTEKKLGPWKDD